MLSWAREPHHAASSSQSEALRTRGLAVPDTRAFLKNTTLLTPPGSCDPTGALLRAVASRPLACRNTGHWFEGAPAMKLTTHNCGRCPRARASLARRLRHSCPDIYLAPAAVPGPAPGPPSQELSCCPPCPGDCHSLTCSVLPHNTDRHLM